MDITNYFTVQEVGDGFTGTGAVDMSFKLKTGTTDVYTISMTDGATPSPETLYTAELTAEQMGSSGAVLLKNSAVGSPDTDSITVTFPKLTKLPANVIEMEQIH